MLGWFLFTGLGCFVVGVFAGAILGRLGAERDQAKERIAAARGEIERGARLRFDDQLKPPNKGSGGKPPPPKDWTVTLK